MPDELRPGSHGPRVTRLQEALNAGPHSPNLRVTGVYDGMTTEAVRQFQNMNWLVPDGVAGRSTQACLNGEAYTPILHDVPFHNQPTRTTCWAASTAMMVRSTVAQVRARTPAAMIGSDGGLRNWSFTDQAITRGQEYASIHGLRCNGPQTYSEAGLRSKLQRGPLMFDVLWDITSYLRRNASIPGEFMGSPGHMIVVVGMRGDGAPDGRGTTLRIYDPWPPNQGEIYSVGYASVMRRLPGATYRVFER